MLDHAFLSRLLLAEQDPGKQDRVLAALHSLGGVASADFVEFFASYRRPFRGWGLDDRSMLDFTVDSDPSLGVVRATRDVRIGDRSIVGTGVLALSGRYDDETFIVYDGRNDHVYWVGGEQLVDRWADMEERPALQTWSSFRAFLVGFFTDAGG